MAQGVDDHTDTDEDEGDAEELTLIESDGLNKLVLPRLLDELDGLDEETCYEGEREKRPDDEPLILVARIATPVEPHTYGEDEQVGERLVDGCRVTRHTTS